MFKGSFTALITPFKGGEVDDKAFQQLVEWQIAEGSHGLVPVGTTGESPTLSHDEHKHVVELCIKAAKNRVPVIAGAGSNSTAEAIDFSRHAKVVGVKDATANVGRVTQQRLACGKNFVQLSGEDGTALGFMAHGGHGCISVSANLAPRLCSEFQNACLNGDWKTGLALQDRLIPLHDVL